MAELLPCKCGKIPKIVIVKNPYDPQGCFVGRVICKCGEYIGDYGLFTENKEFLTNVWNANKGVNKILEKDVQTAQAEIERLKWSKSTSLKEFEEKVKLIIEEMVDVMFDDNISRCFINNCKKPTSIPCDSKICIEENKAFWTAKINNLLKEMESENK